MASIIVGLEQPGPSLHALSIRTTTWQKTIDAMTHWERAKQLFAQALEVTPEKRELFLATACAGEESLRKELESLLSAHVQAKGFMESPTLGDPLVPALLDSTEGGRDTRVSPVTGQ